MQAKPSFVGSDGTVKLYPVTRIYMDLTIVIHPRYAEFQLPLRLNQTLQQGVPAIFFLIGFHHCPERFQHFPYGLMEFRFCRILLFYQFNNLINIRHTAFTS